MAYDKKRIERAADAAWLAALRVIGVRDATAEAAFKDAMAELYDAAVGLSSLIVGRRLRNRVHVEDCVQEIWVAMLNPEKIAGFARSKGSFCSWFGRFVHWKALDFGRKLGVKDEDLDSVGENGDAENAAPAFTADESFLETRVGIAPEQLKEAMKELSTIHRDMLILCFLEGQSHGEVAQIMGVSDDAVRARKSQALKQLREVFQKRRWL